MEKLEEANASKGVYSRCASILKACPHCGLAANGFLIQARTVLGEFADHPSITTTSKATWKSKSALARVYDRVNSIRHKKPNADSVSDLPTATRWDDAAEALRDLAMLMADLGAHWNDAAAHPTFGSKTRVQ
jgi:hypothetical protein